MDNIPYFAPPRWWEPRLWEWFIRLVRPYRRLRLRYWERVSHVEVRGAEHVRQALDRGCGVLIVSNHAAHADPVVLLTASEQVGRFFYYMANWQSFYLLPRFSRRVLQWHGCFSIDREGTDVPAFDQAVRVVRAGRHPLAVFAEGYLQHHYQRVAPFRAGAAHFAQAAAREVGRPVVCLPAAVVYRYTRRPWAELGRLVSQFEQKVGRRPAPNLSLPERVRLAAEAALAGHEERYLGHARPGSYGERAEELLETILRRLEAARESVPRTATVPARLARLRRFAIQQKVLQPADPAAVDAADRHLRDLQVAAQLYSSAHDFDADETTFEHLAEVVDKLEEDVLGVVSAGTRGRRHAYVEFGPPVPVPAEPTENARRLASTLHGHVQALVDAVIDAGRPWDTVRWGGPTAADLPVSAEPRSAGLDR